MERICGIEGCSKKLYAKMLCQMHYQRARVASREMPRCASEGCSGRAYYVASGLCRTHYNALTPDDYWTSPDRVASHHAASLRYIQNPANRLLLAERRRDWADRNPDRVRDNRERWRADNPDRMRSIRRENEARRRARKLANGFEAVDFDAILAEHGMVCHLCTLPIATRAELHFDHVNPLALGGEHTTANIRPAHAVCNMRKGSRAL